MIRKLLLSASALAAMLPGVASAAWYQASSKHFVVYANDDPDKVKAYTAKLERFDKAIRVWHVAPEEKRGPASRVTIFVMDDVNAIQKLSGSSTVAGFYISRASGSVAFMPRSGGSGDLTAQAILFHEYTHHWMLTTWADAAFPYWFTEGFAEMHATASVLPNGTVIFGANPLYRRWTIGRENLMPAPDLLRVRPSDSLSDGSRDAVYSRGWLLVHYLTFDLSRRKQMSDYIGAINSGKPINEAARIFGNPDTLDQKMNVWVKQPKYPSAQFTAAELPIGDISLRPLSAGEAAAMPAMIVSKRGVSDKSAVQVATLARRLAAPYPNDAGAQNELAEAEFDLASSTPAGADALAGFARAEAAADRAIAADPRSIHALLYKGMAMEQIAAGNAVTDPAKWQAIRKWFLAANKIDTEDPEPLVQYFDSFAAAKQKPGVNAQNALIYAYALAPYDGGLRIKAGTVFLEQGKAKEARIALAPVAYNFEMGGFTGGLQKVLDLIDAGDTAGALKLLTTPPEKKDDKGKKGG
jgi:hypothetical protein